jgi:hypothetical protein
MIILISCFAVTVLGTVESIFGRDQLVDPSGIKVKRGAGRSGRAGVKERWLSLRKYVKDSENVLASHGAVEPPNLSYYFGRLEYSFFDLFPKEAIQQFYRLKHDVDVVVCSETQAAVVGFDNTFRIRAIIRSENKPRMLIYTKPHVEMPLMTVDVDDLNKSFDREYAWRVGFR